MTNRLNRACRNNRSVMFMCAWTACTQTKAGISTAGNNQGTISPPDQSATRPNTAIAWPKVSARKNTQVTHTRWKLMTVRINQGIGRTVSVVFSRPLAHKYSLCRASIAP